MTRRLGLVVHDWGRGAVHDQALAPRIPLARSPEVPIEIANRAAKLYEELG